MTKLNLLLYIVDDVPSDLEMMAMWLRSDTFDIKLFNDAKEFKEALNRDVLMVIMDICMPNFDICETVQQIKRDFEGIYIIVVSGNFEKKDYRDLMNLHVWNTVEKSSSVDWLEELKLKVNLTVPKMLNKKMALIDGYR